MLKKLKLFQMVNAEKHSKGNSADPTHESLFTGLGEYDCICEKNRIKASIIWGCGVKKKQIYQTSVAHWPSQELVALWVM